MKHFRCCIRATKGCKDIKHGLEKGVKKGVKGKGERLKGRDSYQVRKFNSWFFEAQIQKVKKIESVWRIKRKTKKCEKHEEFYQYI